MFADVELGADFAAFGTGANLRALGSSPQHQTKGIQKDRLASARLAGDHREAGAELDVEFLH